MQKIGASRTVFLSRNTRKMIRCWCDRVRSSPCDNPTRGNTSRPLPAANLILHLQTFRGMQGAERSNQSKKSKTRLLCCGYGEECKELKREIEVKKQCRLINTHTQRTRGCRSMRRSPRRTYHKGLGLAHLYKVSLPKNTIASNSRGSLRRSL